MKASVRIHVIGVVCAAAIFCEAAVGAWAPGQAQAKAVDARILEPWPDASELDEKQKEAQNRRLFRSAEVLPITLTADFGAVQRDRNPESEQTFPATIDYPLEDGTTASTPIRVRTRGHSRRKNQTCAFAPLRLEFDKPLMKGTVFAGHNNLKLGTHCRNVNEFEEYVLREHTAYRIYNLITPQSFRTRLAKATYVDAKNKRTIGTRYALLIEDDDDVADRLRGRIMSMPGIPFTAMDMETLTRMFLFEYMIGNTDVSAANQHNVRLVQTSEGRRYPVPYDFDYSGLVDTTYSVPDKQFNIANVRERLYRGPCRTPADLEPFFQQLRDLKPEVMALYDTQADLSQGYRRRAKDYLEEFYRTIDRPGSVKRAFVDGCNGRIGAN